MSIELDERLGLSDLLQRCRTKLMEALSTRRARFFKSRMFRRRCASVFMSELSEWKSIGNQIDTAIIFYETRICKRAFSVSEI